MAHPVRKMPAGARAFRTLLSMYPAAFRDEYGREMSLLFFDEYRDTPSRWGRARLWVRALGGIAIWGIGGEDPANWDVLRAAHTPNCQIS